MADNFMCNPGGFRRLSHTRGGKVVAIETQEISGCELQLFGHFIRPRPMTLRVPVTKADVSGLRRLSTRRSWIARSPP